MIPGTIDYGTPRNSLRRFRYFRCCGFFLVFRFCHILPLLSSFLPLWKDCICRALSGHSNGRSKLKIFPSSVPRVFVVPLEGIRPYGGRTKADALRHFKPITVEKFELSRFPAYLLPNMVRYSSKNSFHHFSVSPWR